MSREADWVESRRRQLDIMPRRPDRVRSRWETLADPEGTMPPAAKRKKADQMMRRHMAKMRKVRNATTAQK